MRVVQWEEFAGLPAGTVYSKREATKVGDGWRLWEGLFVKGETAGDVDHWEARLVPCERGPLNAGAAFDLSESRSACEGVFRHHYAVFEPADLLALRGVIDAALAAAGRAKEREA